MTQVSVARLLASLSEYLTRVQSGEEITVMNRDKPVASLVPLARVHPLDQRLAEVTSESEYIRALQRRGILTIHGSGLVGSDFWQLPQLDDPEGTVLQGLLDERAAAR